MNYYIKRSKSDILVNDTMTDMYVGHRLSAISRTHTVYSAINCVHVLVLLLSDSTYK